MHRKGNIRIFLLFFFPVCFLLSIVSLLGLTSHSVSAVDELYLTGVIQSVDLKLGMALVDVKSKNCHGLRRFRTDDSSSVKELEGKKISFSINSSVCKSDGIYKITSLRLLQEVNPR